MFDAFHRLPVSHDLDDGKMRSRDVIVDTQVKFSTLLLEPQIHDGLAKCGFIYLSPIQQNALPLVLTGSSIIAHAKSGTGKTLIYVLPILNDFVKRKLNGLQCLVLAPTREIAKQIYDVFQNVACFVKGLHIEYFIGGTPLDMDVIKCMTCNLAIGAPGRIKHLIDLGYLKTVNLEFLVLDEVDALFDHKEYAVEDIISTLPPPKQLIVCTATFSPKVGELVKSVVPSVKYTSADKLEIEEISSISNMLIAVKQYVAPVKKDSSSMGAMRKREKLVEILKKFNFEQCFIFVNYMTLVRSICNHLINQDFSALWICSDQNQSSRINTINKLKMNHCKILVTTDLAARGIDVHKVNLVINLGLPCPPETYIHRMGRAGRYGSEGAVITILSEGEEMTTFTKMISVISTDPIDLHILPEQIDATMSNINIIQCLPTEGSISVDEFSFKRQMKDSQEKTAVKVQNDKKSKKKKRKGANVSKLALQNSIPDQLSSVDKNNVVMANHEEDNPVSDEMVNECIKQFSQSLADFLVAGERTPEWNSIKYLFGLKDEPTTSDESFAFVQNPPASLLTYALYIKQRNELIDEQIVPCSVDEFLSLLNRSNSTFVRHSSGLYGLIKEISSKIERPAKQQLNVGRFITSSDRSSFDSEQSEISSQVSSVGITSLSQQLLETMINDGDEKNISGRAVKKNNANSWSKKFSGSFNLAEEFSSAMMNFGREEYFSSSKPSVSVDTFKPLLQSDFQNTAEKFDIVSPKQFFNNYKRLNSDVENKKYPKDTDSEMRHSTRVCNEIERPLRSVNTFQDSVAGKICSQDAFEEHETSPNQSSKNLNHSNLPSEDETQLDESVTERSQVDEAECTLNLSDQFSHAVDNSTLENGSQNSSRMTLTSATDFSASQNHSNSISTKGQLPNMKSETYKKAKHISRDFNLSGQFLNTVCTSLVETNFQNPLKSSKTSPLRSPNNFNRSDQFSTGTQARNENSEKQVSNDYSSGNISLSDQFLASVNHREYNRGKPSFDLEPQTKCNGLEDSKNSLNADGLSHNLFCKTDAHSFNIVPEFADQEILAVPKKNAENISKPMTDNFTLSDQFLGAFESKKRPEITSNILDSSDPRLAAINQSSGNLIPAIIPNIEEVSGRSFSLVSKSKSQSNGISVPNRKQPTKSTSHLIPEVTFKPKSSLKSIPAPEIDSKSNISAVVEMNNSCDSITVMKNPNSLSFSDNEANKESSLLISNSKQKPNLNIEVPSDLKSNRVEFANYRSEYLTEHSKNYIKMSTTNKGENRLAQKFTSDCPMVKDKTCDINVTKTVRKPSFGNVHQSENFKPSNNAVPISSKYVAPGSKALDTDFINRLDETDRLNLLCDNKIAVTLPSLRSHVGSQEEQKIWQHHFAFIRRHSVSRGRVMASQRQ